MITSGETSQEREEMKVNNNLIKMSKVQVQQRLKR